MLIVIVFFAGFSFSAYITFRNCITYIANEIGINKRFYPKHYITLSEKIYKILKTNKKRVCQEKCVSLFIKV